MERRQVMAEWLVQPAETSVLAFVTTLHCAVLLLRHYQSSQAARLAVLPSLFFAATPWFLSTFSWLAIGIAAHLAWFVACERLLPQPLPPQPAVSPPPAPRNGFQPLAVLAVIAETPQIRTFRLARPPGFTFRAGQFLMVRVPIGGNPVVRCYSITSAPATAGYLEISVRNQGEVSRHLHETLRAGATLEASGPGGAFVYPPGGRPIVLLAGGIGITPLLAMLRYGLASEPSRAITLILSAKTADQVPFLDELRTLEHRHPQFRLAITLSSGSSDPAFFSGRIDRAIIERTVPDAGACTFMICGPLPMIDEMRRVLEILAVPPEHVHFEKFEAAVSLAGSSASGARLSLRKSHRTVSVAPGQTLLEAAEATGVSLPSLCRVGVCATCRVRLVDGEVDGDFDAIDSSEQAEGFILACIARPLTDCAIDA
ncbi:MAG TPA: 2Fe-2S iron-sulfur cluster-binding protein [Thermoanaerobaculia bacterium]|nr:2Fe-2S iron-sulfur cluster-binding protein [Thermoanaerobaculia bacterium]